MIYGDFYAKWWETFRIEERSRVASFQEKPVRATGTFVAFSEAESQRVMLLVPSNDGVGARVPAKADQEEEVVTMANDDRDILEMLRFELEFIEQGGYGRSVRTPWKPTSVFQDSVTCINFGYPYRAHPCSECHLLDFVPPERRSEVIPCHHIPLNEAGDTVETLDLNDNQQALENSVKQWLRARISQIEEERAKQQDVNRSAGR